MSLTTEQHAAINALGFGTVSIDTAQDVIAALIELAVGAQLDEPSDEQAEVLSAMGDETFVGFDEAAGRVRAAVEQALADWVAEITAHDAHADRLMAEATKRGEALAEMTYDPEVARAISDRWAK